MVDQPRGRRLGTYQILSRLGAGGMGEVYRARDLKLGRDVAIKVLPERFTADPRRLARFKREARVLAALNHPHIAAIYELEEAGESFFLVLELVEGETLARRIARRASGKKRASATWCTAPSGSCGRRRFVLHTLSSCSRWRYRSLPESRQKLIAHKLLQR